MNSNTRAHKKYNSISIFLPAVGHRSVHILYGVVVNGKELSGAVMELGFSL